MSPQPVPLPSILVPYPGAATEEGYQDIFVYLRPETNGVLAESTILKVIRTAEEHKKSMALIFLANFPGDFILEKHIVEQYYAIKFHFAAMGKAAFTPRMAEKFTHHFGAPFEKAPILGAFEAIQVLKKDPEELFKTWVEDADLCFINGQSVKKVGPYYIVNYDIPALVHKNSKKTDIAVMIFRTNLDYASVRILVEKMHGAICSVGILDPQFDAARAFHYSKGPFEQILDGIAYLGADERLGVGLRDFTFVKFLQARSVKISSLCKLLMNPIVRVESEDGELEEENFFHLTQFLSYQEAYEKFLAIKEHVELVHHGPLLMSSCDCEFEA